jgi:outer membrane protein assembly factor BamB
VPGAERLEDGTTMVTVRNLNRVIAVEEDGTLAWEVALAQSTGIGGEPFDSKRPHDTEFTGEGIILVPTHGPSLVVEIDIATGQHIWSWDPKERIKGAQGPRDANRLSNGNTLVTLGNHIVEVNPDGEIVWLLNSRRLSQPNGEVYPSAAGLSVSDLAAMPRCFYKGVLIDPTGVQSGG